MQTENKNRNQEFLEKYDDILSQIMLDRLHGQTILYIVKGIMISGQKLEDCFGYPSLYAYLKQKKQIQKIEYIKQHKEILEMNLMNRIGGQSILYILKEILVSKNPLTKCPEFQALNEYVEIKEEIQRKQWKLENPKPKEEKYEAKKRQEELAVLHILSCVVNIVSKSQDTYQVNAIKSLYPYVEKTEIGEGYQKQMISIA